MKKRDKQVCALCGYSDDDYILIQVPLTHPAKTNAICFECIDDILAELYGRGAKLQQGDAGEITVARPLGS